MEIIDPNTELKEIENIIVDGATPSPNFNKVLTLVKKRTSKRASIINFMKQIKAEACVSSKFQITNFIQKLKSEYENLKIIDNEIIDFYCSFEDFTYEIAEILEGNCDQYMINIFILIYELEDGKVEWETHTDNNNSNSLEDGKVEWEIHTDNNNKNNSLDDERVGIDLPKTQEVIVIDEHNDDVSLNMCEFKEISSNINETIIPLTKDFENESTDTAVIPLKFSNTIPPIFNPYHPILQPSFYHSLKMPNINLGSDLDLVSLIAEFLVPSRETSEVTLEADPIFPSVNNNNNNLITVPINLETTDLKCTFVPIFEILNITMSTTSFLVLYKEICNNYGVYQISIQSLLIYEKNTVVLFMLFAYSCEMKSIQICSVVVKNKFMGISERSVTHFSVKYNNYISPFLHTEPLKILASSPLPSFHKFGKYSTNLDKLNITAIALFSNIVTNKKKNTFVLNINLNVKNAFLECLEEYFRYLKLMNKYKYMNLKIKNENKASFPYDRGKVVQIVQNKMTDPVPMYQNHSGGKILILNQMHCLKFTLV